MARAGAIEGPSVEGGIARDGSALPEWGRQGRAPWKAPYFFFAFFFVAFFFIVSPPPGPRASRGGSLFWDSR
jgi:hypothetical protein